MEMIKIRNSKKKKFDVAKILKEATKEMWNRDPERKELQQTLKLGPETIDDFVFNNWITGL